jgi:hypothetical protein
VLKEQLYSAAKPATCLTSKFNFLEIVLAWSYLISMLWQLAVRSQVTSLEPDSLFNTQSGLDLGDINFNYSNDKANVNIKSSLTAAPKINFDASVDTNFQNHVVGIAGSFDVASGASGPVALGKFKLIGNTQCSWKADDITNPCVGTGSLFVKLPENKDFCCYGVQITTGAEAKMSLAAATTCCKNTMKYKLDHDGSFHIAKLSKLSANMSLNLNSSLNLKNLSSGNHKFGAGLSWE